MCTVITFKIYFFVLMIISDLKKYIIQKLIVIKYILSTNHTENSFLKYLKQPLTCASFSNGYLQRYILLHFSFKIINQNCIEKILEQQKIMIT